jgi:hypothetical protein
MTLWETGERALRDTLSSGGDVAKLMTDLYRNQTAGTSDLFSGCASSLLQVYVAVRDADLAPHYDDADLDGFLHSPEAVMAATLTQKLAQADAGPWLSSRLTAITAAVVAVREKLTFHTPLAIAPAPPEPIAVRVVGMPDRVTESSVKYDADGNIKSTTQTERDAAPKA